MKNIRIILIGVVLAAVPVARYVCEYRLGARCDPYGYSMMHDLWFFLPVPVAVGLVTAVLAPVRGCLQRLAVGAAALVLAPFIAIFAVPAGAVIYSHGFEHAVQKQPGLAELQGWAHQLLDDFHAGKLPVTNEPSYWSPGDVLIPTNHLPVFLTTGIFAPRGIPNFGPEVSVCTNGGKLDFKGECVTVSWYLHGLLIGAPDFKNEWDPWYCKQLSPGVYSYHSMK